MEDSKIIDLFLARNEDAIRHTADTYGRRLFTLADNILKNDQDAEESVNDTYMRSWDTIPPQRPRHFFAYLAKICRHFALDKLDWKSAVKRKAEVISLTQEMENCIPDRIRERELESRLTRTQVGRAASREVGELRRAELTVRQWAADTAKKLALGRPALRRVAAAVEGDSPEDQAVREVLLALGCHVEEAWRPGIPAFRADRGGFRLTARDERGALLESGQVLSLIALIEMENGGGRVAVPAHATAGVDVAAAGYNGEVLRLERDGRRARDLYAALPWLWSAPAAAGRICARMGVSGQRLESLAAKTPRFHSWRREVKLEGERSRILEQLAGETGRVQRGEGLRLRAGSGWVCLSPARRHALRVVAEDTDMETAAELCDFFAGRAAALGRKLLEQDKNRQSSS